MMLFWMMNICERVTRGLKKILPYGISAGVLGMVSFEERASTPRQVRLVAGRVDTMPIGKIFEGLSGARRMSAGPA